jgi:hypothetical protein
MRTLSPPRHQRAASESRVVGRGMHMSKRGRPDKRHRRVISMRLTLVSSVGIAVALLAQAVKSEAEGVTAEAVTEMGESEAKECLRSHGPLVFEKLTTLNPRVAAMLAKHKHGLALNALESIDEATAIALSRAECDLSLDGLMTVDEPAAVALSRSQAKLSMTGLCELKSVALARKLAKQGHLRLPRIPVIDRPVAAVMGECRCTLEAGQLTILDHEAVARALVGDGQRDVSLPYLQKLTADGAKGLIDAQCDLRFPNLTSIDEDTANVLAHHVGVLDLDSACRVSTKALEALLGNSGSIGLGSLASLGDPVSAGVLDALAKHGWPLCLSGLRSITPEEAAALRDRRSATNLAGIKTLTQPTAEALLHCRGYLWLTGVERLEPGVAETLLRHKASPGTGFVFSVDLREAMPERLVEAFERHEGVSFGNPYCP